MKRFALLGNPLGHSLSPVLHKAIYRQLEIDDASYRAIELDSDTLPGFFSGFRVGGFDGVNVTIPHKQSVIDLLDEVDAKARLINAVNCIHRQSNKLIGYNTDMLGFAHSLRASGGEIEGQRFAVFGSGGSALAVGAVLSEGGAKSISIVNRSAERAEQLRAVIAELNSEVEVQICDEEQLAASHTGNSALNCLINTTPIGMSPAVDKSPVNDLASLISSDTLVFDLVYNPSETQLLKDAQKLGAATANGVEMLIAQAVYSVEIWMGGNIVQHVDMNCLVKEIEKILGH